MFKDFLFEGQNEDRAKSLLVKSNKFSDEIFNKFLSITEPYKTNPHGKNNKHLPKLVEFALEGNSLDIIKSYYDKFMKNSKLSSKPIDNMNFQEFENIVDSTATKVNVDDKDIDDKPIYEDNNIKVFLGDNKQKCINYGQGRKYGFCISRIDQSNLYHGYRSRGATFYFVYFKTKEAQSDAPENIIVIHAYPNNQYQINYATPNQDHPITKEEIINKFPVLENIFDDVFVYKPFNEKEQNLYKNVLNASSISRLKTLDDKLLYIETGHQILDYEWNEYKNNDEIIKKYIETGMFDIPSDIIDKSKFKNRYYDKIRQRIEIKSEQVEKNKNYVGDLIESLTPDELYIWTSDSLQKDYLSEQNITTILKYSLQNYLWKTIDVLLDKIPELEIEIIDLVDLFRVPNKKYKDSFLKIIYTLMKHNHYIPLSSLSYGISSDSVTLGIYEKIIEYNKDDPEEVFYNSRSILIFLKRFIESDKNQQAINILIELFKRYDYQEDKKHSYFDIKHEWEKICYYLSILTEDSTDENLHLLYKLALDIKDNVESEAVTESFKRKIKLLLN